jgi:hypothetical protein
MPAVSGFITILLLGFAEPRAYGTISTGETRHFLGRR